MLQKGGGVTKKKNYPGASPWAAALGTSTISLALVDASKLPALEVRRRKLTLD